MNLLNATAHTPVVPVEMTATLLDNMINSEIEKVRKAFADREDYEYAHNPEKNDVVKDNLRKESELFEKVPYVTLMLEHNINAADFLNTTELNDTDNGARFNMKAITRVRNFVEHFVLKHLAKTDESVKVKKVNHTIPAFIRNAKFCADKGIDFTNDIQLATLDNRMACDVRGIERITTITGGANTQASITRQAMRALGIATRYFNVANKPCLRVDFEHPLVKAFL